VGKKAHFTLSKKSLYKKKLNEFEFLVFNVTFSNISAISWRPVFSGGGSRSTRREPPTLGKQLVNFITCGCESSAPFFVIYKAGLLNEMKEARGWRRKI